MLLWSTPSELWQRHHTQLQRSSTGRPSWASRVWAHPSSYCWSYQDRSPAPLNVWYLRSVNTLALLRPFYQHIPTPITREGFALLGCPIPPAHCDSVLQARVDKMKETLRLSVLNYMRDSQVETTIMHVEHVRSHTDDTFLIMNHYYGICTCDVTR